MMPFIEKMCKAFVMVCNIPVPIAEGKSIPVYVFLIAGLGFVIAFKFIRGLYA